MTLILGYPVNMVQKIYKKSKLYMYDLPGQQSQPPCKSHMADCIIFKF